MPPSNENIFFMRGFVPDQYSDWSCTNPVLQSSLIKTTDPVLQSSLIKTVANGRFFHQNPGLRDVYGLGPDSTSSSDVPQVKVEPHGGEEVQMIAIIKDRQKKDNHNMSTCVSVTTSSFNEYN